ISSQQHEITELKKEGRSYLWEGNEFVPYYEYIDQKERLFFSGINDQGVAFLGRKVCEE
ncbi:arabinan endo-1,5-alpha-L-arabinosidase, partial [Enterococcus faecium]|nr:arabinan endo-1,5-alpha-L-arabinosidase [Enterococcus faecium]